MLEILWNDSLMTHNGWHSAFDYDFDNTDRMLIQSVGYLLQKDETSITLIQSKKFQIHADHEHDAQIANVIQIPRGCIHRINKL